MKDFRSAGVIVNSLWDVSGWSGVSWLIPPGGTKSPPGVGLVFKDAEIGAAIFRGWNKRFTNLDRHEVVTVSVITGLHPIHGNGTSIYIGTDIGGLARQDYADANLVIEPHVHINSIFMFCPGSPHPDTEFFGSERRKYNDYYFLTPCHLHPQTLEAVPQFDFQLRKRRISFLDFSKVAPTQIEYAALLA